MADTDQVQIPDDARAVAEELNLGPEDLLKLPDYIKLAKELGVDLKDLLVNKFTVAFAQTGSTLVPFEFVLLEEGFGGGPDGVVDKNSCVITVLNETKQT